ncbi:MAG TPA: SRPBCC domain-containing protein [Candidatus Acidoferrales bacterium]|nr:SRPBCC domain-containing protein [Candidatus Acidoferrales bacterium]
MKEFKASTSIQAPAEKIWSVLTNVSAWPEWDPNCEKVEGQAVLGNKLKVFTKLSPGRAFPVKVTELTPNRKMTWTGGMPFGIFTGVRTYTLDSKSEGNVDFTMHEVFSGPMLGLIGKSIPDMSAAFEQFCSGLKTRSEKS